MSLFKKDPTDNQAPARHAGSNSGRPEAGKNPHQANTNTSGGFNKQGSQGGYNKPVQGGGTTQNIPGKQNTWTGGSNQNVGKGTFDPHKQR